MTEVLTCLLDRVSQLLEKKVSVTGEFTRFITVDCLGGNLQVVEGVKVQAAIELTYSNAGRGCHFKVIRLKTSLGHDIFKVASDLRIQQLAKRDGE